MKKYWVYFLSFISVILVVLAGYYYISDISMEKNSINQTEVEREINVQLKPGEPEFRLDGTVISVDHSSNPLEILITPFFSDDIFLVTPEVEERRLIVTDETEIVEGKPFTETTEAIEIDDLQEGDRLVIRTIESVLDIATRGKYTAISIRKVILD